MKQIIIIEGDFEDIISLIKNIKKTHNVKAITENHIKVSQKNEKEILDSFINEIKEFSERMEQEKNTTFLKEEKNNGQEKRIY